MSRYAHVVAYISSHPWAILPERLEAIAELIADHAANGPLAAGEVRARLDAARDGQGPRNGRRGGATAVIPVYGVLVPKADLFAEVSGATSVSRVRSMFREALADDEVERIVLDVDSPGGSVEQIPELAAEIRAARGRKPITAIANTLMASAGYWLGSQADEVVASPSALVGSIGVYAVHEDWSGAYEAMGIRSTLISAGRYKTEGTDLLPLADEARTHLQEIVDDAYAMFVEDVAAGRGVSSAKVRAGYGEGRVLTAATAKAARLVDRIETFDAALSRAPRMKAAAAQWTVDLVGSGGTTNTTAAPVGLAAGPIRSHSTATTDEPWDGPANEARLPSSAGPLRRAHAWVEDGADPDLKSSYKFIHHEVSAGGSVGAANINGCANGRAVLRGGRGGTTIPAGDKPGVWDHLAAHERDAGRDVPSWEEAMASQRTFAYERERRQRAAR